MWSDMKLAQHISTFTASVINKSNYPKGLHPFLMHLFIISGEKLSHFVFVVCNYIIYQSGPLTKM